MENRVAVLELVAALDRAEACRDGSVVDAICQPCWIDVGVAVDAVRNVLKAQALAGTPRPGPD